MKFDLSKVYEILPLYKELLKGKEVRIKEKYIEIYDIEDIILITFEILENDDVNICFNYDDYYTSEELEEIMSLFVDLKGSLRK